MNKKWRNLKKVFLIVILLVICFNVFPQTVFGEVNKTYGDNTGVVTNNLEEALEDDDSFLSMITGLIYIVASGAEWLIQGLFTMTTGMQMFPWADRVIFNAIPFLDVNFINPSSGSLFLNSSGNTTAIAQIVSNMYYTVFVLATAFLGICVGIMALRLVFASIADDKTRYKKSLMQVILAMIMLFLSHYMISFIFMVNEKMVEVAYSILLDTTDGMQINVEGSDYLDKRKSYLCIDNGGGLLNSQDVNNAKNNFFDETSGDREQLINFWAFSKTTITGNSQQLAETLSQDKYYKYAVALITGEFKNGTETITLDGWENYCNNELTGIYNNKSLKSDLFSTNNRQGIRLFNLLADIEFLANMDEQNFSENSASKQLEGYTKYQDWDNTTKDSDGLTEWESTYEDPAIYTKTYDKVSKWNDNNDYARIHYSTHGLNYLIQNSPIYANQNKDELLKSMSSEDLAKFLFNTYNKLKDIEYADKADAEINNKQAISSLGILFKKNAYNPKSKENKYNIIACILYTMFIVQSVMYFIAYIKRFFYILILALFAPLVIVFDFLTNAAK